ncbi:methyl-accepting chemotaxis protein [Aetokthonos hydrillicola Thurmond2011]|jgi:methyl-accepting chemotaxis protein|uniref:Methyl-accepting chemotaxis protein n=2 Tax=Aetokthonos TaxID=1550243 RepID=A0AAP5I754_9CYAN|nr:methyl-accepting chemotaxis protein [Aetokthonos hydrillicola CCALA 1050]MBW4585461.1 methyl-accepting chemotaxis protein [Aetokthonos hydrillicola CCALA 1050]MDR9896081.1 methyl-accepting chemotaxis protein [Aetokthonos hydrillicola Thurmond2011]
MLLYFTVSGITDNINVGRLEIFGNRFLEPLTHLLVLVPQHQRLGKVARRGDLSVFNELEATAQSIDKNFENLEKETKALGEVLKITLSGLRSAGMEQLIPAKLAAEWQTLRNNQTISQENLEQHYNDLIQHVRGLISRVGDTSNSILDPVLDSYYLMDVVLAAIPEAQQRVGEALLFAESLTSQPRLTNEQRVKLEVYALSLQQADLDRIVQGIATSIRENKNFFGIVPSLQMNIPPGESLYKTAVTKFSERLIQLARTDKGDILKQDFFQLGDEVLRKGSELWTVARKELDKIIERRIQYYENTRLIYLLLSLTALVISSFFVFKVSREISERLIQVVAITKDIARGNLTPNIFVDSKDEIGELLLAVRYMVQDLSSLIKNTQESGIKVSSSATELLTMANQQEVVIMNQTESTDNSFLSIKEISQLIENLVQKMSEVTCMSEETAEFASRGQSELVHMEDNMQNMETASNNIYNRLQTIKERGEKITFVVTTMAKLAEQINILSLNAAIESEKAGEYGTGFSVVSREIRRLADQTAVAALEIKQIVDDTQLAVSFGVEEVEQFMVKVREEVRQINKISADFTKIIDQVQALLPNFESVSIGMQHQSKNTKKISDSMIYLNQGMLQIKNSLRKTYAAIEQLNEASLSLNDSVSRFHISTSKK